MATQRYHCLECNEPHDAEMWYSRQHLNGTSEYLCGPKLKRADLDSDWEPVRVSD